MRVSLDGQVAIVTGAGAGLGRAYALELARRGAHVLVNDIEREAADAVVAEIEEADGRAAPVYASVATIEGGREIVEAAVDAFGTVDAVVNNAGIMQPGWFEEMDPSLLERHLAVHVGGAFYVTQPAWPIMKAKGYGRVVMISSAGGIFAMQANSMYAAAKGAMYSLGRALALEGMEHGILVNSVLPNADTDMGRNNPVPGYEDYFPAELRAKLLPLRVASGVAPLIAYLASSACTFTGEAFSSTAGRVALVFAGVTEGWVGHHAAMTAEEIAANIETIRDRGVYHVPASLWEEYEKIAGTLGFLEAP